MYGIFVESYGISEFTMDCAERHGIASKTGEWYCYQWWLEDKYYNSKNPFIRKQAETGFNELIKVFDKGWMLKYVNSHPLAKFLFFEGPEPHRLLCRLGLNIFNARKILRDDSFNELTRRLLNPNAYWESAISELWFLSHLCDCEFSIEEKFKTGHGRHNCDFKISKGKEISFWELKRPWEIHSHNQKLIGSAENHAGKAILSNHNKRGVVSGAALCNHPEIKKIFDVIREPVAQTFSLVKALCKKSCIPDPVQTLCTISWSKKG